jgi:putative ABC transport system substrate-binding protein
VLFSAFLEGLHSLGYKEGQNVALVCRSAEGKYERLDALAAELVQLKPEVIIAGGTPGSLAAKRATSAIPILSVYSADPIGLVPMIAGPEGGPSSDMQRYEV